MSAAGIARALWPALRRILIRIGRWVLDDLLEDGVRFVGRYMLKRCKVFRRRLERARTKIRRGWLRRRIVRWQKAAAWLFDNASALRKRSLEIYDRLATRIPETSPWDSPRSRVAA